jgi:RNA polymerase sigma-70 factor, ECF subfamily
MRRIASHLQAVLVAHLTWHTNCFFAVGSFEGKNRWGTKTMQTVRASNVAKESDETLVSAAKNGDMQAFEELILRNEQKVLAIAQRITNHREDAQDVAQETFHKAFRHLNSFQEKARFSTWMTRIAMNEAFMLLRRRRGTPEDLPEGSDDGDEYYSEKFVDRRPTPEESCRLRERNEILSHAINRLGPKIRRAILLRDIEERSAEETARILGTTISAVKARVFQGRRKLRAAVNSGLLADYSVNWAETQRC